MNSSYVCSITNFDNHQSPLHELLKKYSPVFTFVTMHLTVFTLCPLAVVELKYEVALKVNTKVKYLDRVHRVIFTFHLCGRKQHQSAWWPSEEPPSQRQILDTQILTHHRGKQRFSLKKLLNMWTHQKQSKQKSYLRCCQILCSVKHAQGRRAGQEPVQAERQTPETKTQLTE